MSFTMETTQITRQRIITLYNEGYSKFQISRDIGVSYNTVALWIRRHDETGNTDNQHRSDLRTPEGQRKVWNTVTSMPRRLNSVLAAGGGYIKY